MTYMPPTIASSVQAIKRLSKIGKPNNFDRQQLAEAKLRVAIWVCRSEGLPPTRSNVHVVLGEDSDFVFRHASSGLQELELSHREREQLYRSRGMLAARERVVSAVASPEKREAIEKHAKRKSKGDA